MATSLTVSRKFDEYEMMFQELIDEGAHFSLVHIGKRKKSGKVSKYAITNEENLTPIQVWPSARELAINARDNQWATALWPCSIDAVCFDIDSYILEDKSEDMKTAARRFLRVIEKNPLSYGPSLSGIGFHVYVFIGDDANINLENDDDDNSNDLFAKQQQGFLIENTEGIRRMDGEIFYDGYNPIFLYNLKRLYTRYFDIKTKLAKAKGSEYNRYLFFKGNCHRFYSLYVKPMKVYSGVANGVSNPGEKRSNGKRVNPKSKTFKSLDEAIEKIQNLPPGCVYGPSHFPKMIAKIMRSDLVIDGNDENIEPLVWAYLERNNNYTFNEVRKRFVNCIDWWLHSSNHVRPSTRKTTKKTKGKDQ